MTKKTVVITASGLLGRAVGQKFANEGDDVIPMAFTRAGVDSTYTKLDLIDTKAAEGWFATHAVTKYRRGDNSRAAERRPDVAEADPVKAARINSEVSTYLAKLARECDFTLIYISTDYVLNGRPPYDVDAPPDPLQAYGRQKRDGEIAVLAEREHGARATILRVPILYGRTTYNGESAVNVLHGAVADQSWKQYTMDHYQKRHPTNVEDAARVLYDLAPTVPDVSQLFARLSISNYYRHNKPSQNPSAIPIVATPKPDLPKPLPQIPHYASLAPPLTKYNMIQIIAQHLSLPIIHVVPQTEKPSGKGMAERPENLRCL